jgi:hypothetical protein
VKARRASLDGAAPSLDSGRIAIIGRLWDQPRECGSGSRYRKGVFIASPWRFAVERRL